MNLVDPATRANVHVFEAECTLYSGSFAQALVQAVTTAAANIPAPTFPTYNFAPGVMTFKPGLLAPPTSPTQVHYAPSHGGVSFSTKIKKCTCNIRDLMSDTGHVKGCSKL